MLIVGPFFNFQISSWLSFCAVAKKMASVPKTKVSSPDQI